MSNNTGQRTTRPRSKTKVAGQGDGAESLTDKRAEMDVLFAVAARSFENMTEGNSQEFLRRSRQTGGQ